MVKVAVVVDSLSKLLLWQSPSAVCTFLHQLFSSSAGTGINEFIIFEQIWLAHIFSVQRKLGLCNGLPSTSVSQDKVWTLCLACSADIIILVSAVFIRRN